MDVKWGPAPVGGAPTNVPGVYLSTEAFGKARPPELIEMLRGAMAEYVEEFAADGTMETWLVTGRLAYVKGELFAEFRTVSTMSWLGWIGTYPSHDPDRPVLEYVSVEDLEDL